MAGLLHRGALSALVLLLPACNDEGPVASLDPLNYQGLWTLSPTPQLTCSLPLLGVYTATFESVELVAAAGGFDATVSMSLAGNLFATDETVELDVAFDDETGEFGAVVPLGVTDAGTGYSVTATGDFEVDGRFLDRDEFEADIQAGMDISLQTIAGTTTAPCTDLSSSVTGTRVP